MRSVAKKELDCKNRVLNRVSPYLPPSIIQQLHKKPDISALDAIRLLSLLPPEAYEDFPDMPQVPLTFPRDHNRHYFQAHEWFYLAMNLQSVEDPEIPGSKRRIGALSTIAGHTLDPPDPALFALEKTNQLFRHSFSLTLGATDSSPCEHWYIRDQGGFIGDYRPAVHNELPVLSFLAKEPTGKDDSDWDKMNDDEHGVIEQGLLPYTEEEEDDDEEHRDAGRRQSVDAHLKKNEVGCARSRFWCDDRCGSYYSRRLFYFTPRTQWHGNDCGARRGDKLHVLLVSLLEGERDGDFSCKRWRRTANDRSYGCRVA